MFRAGVDFDMKNSVSVDIQTIIQKKSVNIVSKFCTLPEADYHGNLLNTKQSETDLQMI
jgi:hypothetical protein